MTEQDARIIIRNPFGTMDVPAADDREVTAYAATVVLHGGADDVNAAPWAREPDSDPLDGVWSSRWNGGADPTIPGDTPDRWKQGRAELRVDGDRLYIRFNWDDGRRHGLIEAVCEDGGRLVGKYVNLTHPAIQRPWVGRIVDLTRIDGCFPAGRLDFRR